MKNSISFLHQTSTGNLFLPIVAMTVLSWTLVGWTECSAEDSNEWRRYANIHWNHYNQIGVMQAGIKTTKTMDDVDGFIVGHSSYRWDASVELVGNKNLRTDEWSYFASIEKRFSRNWRVRTSYNFSKETFYLGVGGKLWDVRFDVGYTDQSLRLWANCPITDSIRFYGSAERRFEDNQFQATTGLQITITTGKPYYKEIKTKTIEWLD